MLQPLPVPMTLHARTPCACGVEVEATGKPIVVRVRHKRLSRGLRSLHGHIL